MRKDILNRAKLSSSVARVAADVNRDASIDVADIVSMRKVILSRTTYFQKMTKVMWNLCGVSYRVTIWGFRLLSPFSLAEHQQREYLQPRRECCGCRLYQVKLGDVNGDWESSQSGTLYLFIANRKAYFRR